MTFVYRHDPDGGSSTLNFLQKVPRLFDENDRMEVAVRMVKKVKPEILVYHTRDIQNQSKTEIKLLNSSTPPHLVRHIYKTLAGDTSEETAWQEIDEFDKLTIETEDPKLVIDLRHLNKGRPSDTFNVFFKELETIVEELTATDERRHDVVNINQFLSVCDLIKQMKKRVPKGKNILSESIVIHSFAPPNMYKLTMQYYTGRINLKHAIQRRQLRAFHTNSHWCSALYCYLRQVAVQNRGNCVFISCDNKAKVHFGNLVLRYLQVSVRRKA